MKLSNLTPERNLMALLGENLTLESLFGTLIDPVVWADPYPLYEELRTRDAVAKLDDNLWVLSSHEAVHHVLRHPSCSSDERRSTNAIASEEGYPETIGDFMLFMDPPDHTRLRRLVARAFTPRQVKFIEPRAESIVAELLDAARDRGTLDVVSELAHPLALQIICELLGVPFEDRSRFAGWGSALARLVDPGVLRTPEQDAASVAATAEFREYFIDLIDTRRARPSDDLLSELIAAEEDGDRLSIDDLVSVCLLVLVAGYETTVNLVGNGVVALLEHRDQWDRLGAGGDIFTTAVNEFLRHDSPVQMVFRTATDDIDVAGRQIASGDAMITFLAAANRDGDVFDDPHRLDVGRTNNPHVAFGGGIHHCLGAALARTEAVAAFRGLRETFPDMQIAGQPVRRPTFTLRGFTEVPVVV